MNDSQTTDSTERSGAVAHEDFAEVLGRARAKAAGVEYNPEVHHPDRPKKVIPDSVPVQHVENIYSTIDKWMGNARRMPKDAPPPPPAPSAAQVRIGWYIAPRHLGDTLHNFRPVTESQKEALQATCDWVRSVRAGRGGALALIGGVGTGKSHLLYAAIRKLNEDGVHAAAGGWFNLADVFRKAKYSDPEASQVRHRLLAAKALGIDEIRPTSGTGYDTTELAQIMTNAYRECQGVIITSNFADEALEEIIGLAASSRLTQVVIEGPDMRQPENRHLIEVPDWQERSVGS